LKLKFQSRHNPFRDDFHGLAEKAVESTAKIILTGKLNVILSVEPTHCLVDIMCALNLKKVLYSRTNMLLVALLNPINVVLLICFSSLCVPYVASFSGMSFLDRPFGIL